MPITWDESHRRSDENRVEAVSSVLRRKGYPVKPGDVEEIIAAYQGAEVVLPDDCDHVDPTFGQCVRTYGHEPFIYEETLAKFPPRGVPAEEIEPDPNRSDGIRWKVREHGGHYTTEYEDKRRPDGSHPWDF
jgi:hypothetical protein